MSRASRGSQDSASGRRGSSSEGRRDSAADQAKLARASSALFGLGRKAKKEADFVKSVHWRDKRPITVGNWAVPEHLEKTPDLDEWKRSDMEKYFLKFVLTDGDLGADEREDLGEKIKFLIHGSKADFHKPLEECCVDREVNDAAATLACYRTEGFEASCIVKRHEEQKFYIPQLGIEEAMARAARLMDGRSDIEKLQGVHKRRASTTQAADGDAVDPLAAFAEAQGGEAKAGEEEEKKEPEPEPEPEKPTDIDAGDSDDY